VELLPRLDRARRQLAATQTELSQRPPEPGPDWVERQRLAAAASAEELARFARTDRAPEQLRAAQRRVDRSELTWAELLCSADGQRLLDGLA
jgi:predicted Zn-dependent protease